ncbi:hypothetical protein [Cupriavidus lacunae]|uniref:hypothetical protein n=1 Tax=Cupriavidus lacunae TaxID=2666307 RepID=UPI001FC94DFD|nr:hypothetical protein [Cupriavidus lacunae]
MKFTAQKLVFGLSAAVVYLVASASQLASASALAEHDVRTDSARPVRDASTPYYDNARSVTDSRDPYTDGARSVAEPRDPYTDGA